MDMDRRYDYVVVGSGPGGGTVARELTGAGKSCLIVERGPRGYIFFASFPPTQSKMLPVAFLKGLMRTG